MAIPCLAHRLVTDDGDHGTAGSMRIVEDVLETTPSPRP
jgi:hypothetical protein